MSHLLPRIHHSIEEARRAIDTLSDPRVALFVEQASHLIATTFSEGGKLIVAGNGGSLSDATHFAEELSGSFRKKRPALPAIALSDAAHITCVGNDFGFDQIFSRGVEAFGKPGDIFCGLSTSGNSPNILNAFLAAKAQGLKTIAFLGKVGGKCAGIADLELMVDPSFIHSDRIQEIHMTLIHILIEGIEHLLFEIPSQVPSPYAVKEV